MMIAHDKHQCTNSFNCIQEIECKNNCITYCITMYPMSEITLYITLHGSKYNTILRHFLSLILLLNAQFILIALQKLIAKIIEFNIASQCAIMSQITLNITLHRSKTKAFSSLINPCEKHQCTINFLWLQKLIANIIVFIAYQCAIMSEITLNIPQHRSKWNTLVRQLLPWWF